jgi:hypothetical protein
VPTFVQTTLTPGYFEVNDWLVALKNSKTPVVSLPQRYCKVPDLTTGVTYAELVDDLEELLVLAVHAVNKVATATITANALTMRLFFIDILPKIYYLLVYAKVENP